LPPPRAPPGGFGGRPDSEVAGLEDAWAICSQVERLAFLRNKLGSIKLALSPEQLQELAALHPPDPPAHDGMAGNLELLKMGDELKLALPRHAKVHEFCKAVESSVAEKSVAQRREIHG
jgi:hypothetical protein